MGRVGRDGTVVGRKEAKGTSRAASRRVALAGGAGVLDVEQHGPGAHQREKLSQEAAGRRRKEGLRRLGCSLAVGVPGASRAAGRVEARPQVRARQRGALDMTPAWLKREASTRCWFGNHAIERPFARDGRGLRCRWEVGGEDARVVVGGRVGGWEGAGCAEGPPLPPSVPLDRLGRPASTSARVGARPDDGGLEGGVG